MKYFKIKLSIKLYFQIFQVECFKFKKYFIYIISSLLSPFHGLQSATAMTEDSSSLGRGAETVYCDASKWRLGTAAVVPGLPPLALDAVVPACHSLSVLRSTRAPLRNPSSGSCWSHFWCVPHYMQPQALDLTSFTPSLISITHSLHPQGSCISSFCVILGRYRLRAWGSKTTRSHRLVAIRIGLGPRLHTIGGWRLYLFC